jgi:hypothetical protein
MYTQMCGAFLPATRCRYTHSGEPLPVEDWGRISLYEEIIGGIRIFQVRGIAYSLLSRIKLSQCRREVNPLPAQYKVDWEVCELTLYFELAIDNCFLN